jgi:hypothetical protein
LLKTETFESEMEKNDLEKFKEANLENYYVGDEITEDDELSLKV